MYKKALNYLLIIALFIFSFLFIFINSVNSEIFSDGINPVLKHSAKITFPESFGFFTKDPQNEHLKVFILENNEFIKVNLNNNAAESYFGLSRFNRVKLFELGVVSSGIRNRDWVAVKNFESFNEDSLKITTPQSIKYNNKFKAVKKGKYLFFRYDITPWSWRETKKTTDGKYAYVEIK